VVAIVVMLRRELGVELSVELGLPQSIVLNIGIDLNLDHKSTIYRIINLIYNWDY